LCAHAVSRLTRLAKRVKAAGLAPRSRLRDRRRSVGKRVRAISAVRARGRLALGTIDRLTGEIAQRAKQTVREARAVAAEARRLAKRRRGGALVDQLERELEAAEQVLAQTDLRLAGQRTIPDRRISLVDPDARPVRMGRPQRPTEFGYKARVADTVEGFVIADVPDRGGPTDGSLLDGAIAKAKQVGMQVRSVYADRGFGTSTGDAALTRHRIRDPVIPRQQRAAPIEHTRGWKRRYRFRNGLEGRISQLKRKGLRRTRLRSLAGAQTWVAGIVLTHNLQRMALLT
jgi:IS5 family transposase